MGRRFRRFRQFSQRVIKVTRRIAQICSCCGTFPPETQSFVVPLTSVIGHHGNISRKHRDTVGDHHTCSIPVKIGTERANCKPASKTSITERKSQGSSSEDLPNVPDTACSSSDRNRFVRSSRMHDNCSKVPALDDLSLSDASEDEIAEYCKHPRVKPSSCDLDAPREIRSRCPVPLLKNLHSSSETSEEYNTHYGAEVSQNSSTGSISTDYCKVSPGASLIAEKLSYDRQSMPQERYHVPITGKNISSSDFSDLSESLQANGCRPTSVTSNSTPVSPMPSSIVSSSNVQVEHAFPDLWKYVCPDDWTTLKTLSRGKFGIVEVALLKECNQRFVVKACNAIESVQEAKILMESQSPYIVRLYASMTLNNERYMCMQYHETGDLHRLLKNDENRNHIRVPEAIWIISYAVVAVEYLHGRGILHLDIKPLNILIDANGYPVLADFGSARWSKSGEIFKELSLTAAYACPELLQGEQPTELADLWAIACTLYEIIKGESPFKGKNNAETQLKICLGIVPDFSRMPATITDFLKNELQPSKESRLGYDNGVSTIMQHPVFENIDWENVRYGHRQNKSPILPIMKELQGQKEGSRVQCKPIDEQNEHQYISSSSCDSLHSWQRKPSRLLKKKFKKTRHTNRDGGFSKQPLEDESYFGDDDESDIVG